MKIPAQLSRLDLQRDNAIGVEIVALAIVTIGIRIRISSRPVECFGLRIVRAGEPRRSSAHFDSVALPGFEARCTAARNSPEPPAKLTGWRLVCANEAAHRLVRA